MGLNTRDTIGGEPNVKAEYRTAVRERKNGIIVNDVSDLFACLWTTEDSDMSVEWRLGAV